MWGLPLGDNVIARGWTVSGIYTAHTGHPFTVNQSSNNVGTNMTGLPNVIGDVNGPEDRGPMVQHCGVPGGGVRRLRQRDAQPAHGSRASRTST